VPVQNPANLTVHTISGFIGDIGAAVQVFLRATLATGDELYTVQYVRNGQDPKRVTAYIMFEDQ